MSRDWLCLEVQHISAFGRGTSFAGVNIRRFIHFNNFRLKEGIKRFVFSFFRGDHRVCVTTVTRRADEMGFVICWETIVR